MAILEVKNLSFTYPNAEKQALSDVSFVARQGEFILLCGRSGCGKTTLLRCLKKELTPYGECKGEILYNDEPLYGLPQSVSAADIGFVSQNPDAQIVTDRVWTELAFGLESIGVPSDAIRRRVAEVSGFFGITHWFRKEIETLSGGQRQMLVLAAVMAMQPKVLILDEPTSQLDPIAATEFIETLRKINSDLGVTIILSEHRLEEVFGIADRVVIMEDSRIVYDGPPANTGMTYGISVGFPAAMQIYGGLGFSGKSPITVREGREFIDKHYQQVSALPRVHTPVFSEEAVSLENIWFRYDKTQLDILRGLSLSVGMGEFLCVVGGNASGKSTALSVLAGLKKPHRGSVKLFGKRLDKYSGEALYGGIVSLLPQSPQTLFVCDTVMDELLSVSDSADEVIRLMGLQDLANAHPFDLSGGEQQKLAFAKILLRYPRIILLDEPTKGLDAAFKTELAAIIGHLKTMARTVIMATHDLEFAASYADRCVMLFDGEVISQADPRTFFSDNSYYTTHANRIIRHLCPAAITAEDVIALCKTD